MLLKAMLVTGAGVSPRIGAMMAYLGDIALSRSASFLNADAAKKA